MATATSAHAGGPTIIPGPGSNVTCTGLKAKALINPPLKQNWLKSEHSSDPNPAWQAAPDTAFATVSATTTTTATGKAKCTGTVTDGTNTATVSKVAFSASSTSNNAVDPTFGQTMATCSGLATENGTNTFQTTVTFTSKTATIPPITITSSLNTLIDSHGAGFDLIAQSATGVTGTISGDTKAYVDAKTVTAIASSPPSSTSAPKNECEPSAKVKKGVLVLKAPKGLAKIKVGNGVFDGTPSSITFSLS
jgi:hypothetical protein